MGMPLDRWITKGKQEQKEADAALVEAGECVCLYLVYLYDEWGSFGPNNTPDSIITSLVAAIHIDYTTDPPTVTKHAPCCCKVLAEKIRSQS